MAKAKVGVLGSGDVGRALGRGLAAHGYDVMLGSREPKKLDEWRRDVRPPVAAGTFAESAAFGEFAILATAGSGTLAAVDLAKPANFRGKLVIDATNPLDFSRGMPPGILPGLEGSLSESIQHRLPDAHVVKCFNTVGNGRMVDPKFRDGTPRMLICGDDASAKRRTEALLKDLGWPGAIDVGGLEAARYLEALVPLWVRVGNAIGAWDHAFHVVR